MSDNLAEILKNFQIDGKFLSAERYGQGHINDTYLVIFDVKGIIKKYILQRISKMLTNNIPALMRNIELVSEFNRQKIEKRGGNPERESLVLVRTHKDNNVFYYDSDNYYRVYIFIDQATSHQIVTKPEFFYEAAVAFGKFANLLAEFDASQLTETIPNFHNTPIRYAVFLKTVSEDKCGRVKAVLKDIEWVKSREKYISSITSLLESGKIPYRVTHNDTKLNNVMIDDKTGKGIAVIDLDTVMQGSLCYDFGDSIRFGCNPAAEDEGDLSKVNFQIKLFEEFTKGYLSAVGKNITQTEKDNLATGAIIMTYECGVRFLTDYLSGDNYFKISREGQNVDRARTQFKLVEDMEKCFTEMQNIVRKY